MTYPADALFDIETLVNSGSRLLLLWIYLNI